MRSFTGWGTSISISLTSALLIFDGGNRIYGFWCPNGTPALVKVSGADVIDISVTKDGDAYVASWTGNATCLAIG